MAFENEDGRRRQLHDAVRLAATDGFGDDDKRAYSSFKHSGTSISSSAREEGYNHGFKHDLPSARSPAGRWIREYAHAAHHAQLARSRTIVSV